MATRPRFTRGLQCFMDQFNLRKLPELPYRTSRPRTPSIVCSKDGESTKCTAPSF